MRIDESSLTGKNPPEETIVIAKLRELKDLIPKIFKIIKIEIVRVKYNKKILIVCFNISELFKDIKFVRDFFKLSSYRSIKKIIENKKYNPPIHWMEDRQIINPWSICFKLSKIVKPVEVKPETDSNNAFKSVKL